MNRYNPELFEDLAALDVHSQNVENDIDTLPHFL